MSINFEYTFRELNQPSRSEEIRTPYKPPVNPENFGIYSFALLFHAFVFMSLFVM